MRMTDAILPGYTSLGTIKGNANHARPLFSFPPCWQQGKASRHEREHFSLYPGTIPIADRGTFHLKRAHFNICSSASFRRPFPCQLFLPPKPNGPQSIWLSTNSRTAIYNCPSTFFDSQHKGKLPLMLSLKYKIENHQYQCLHYLFSFF